MQRPGWLVSWLVGSCTALHCSDSTALSRPGARGLWGTRQPLRRLLHAQQQGGGLAYRLTEGAGRGQAGSAARVVFVFVNRIRHVGCLVG
jgi:hypothetical protein